MKKLPINVSNFKSMIEDNYIYVDKTKIIYDIITDLRFLFIARPRRFGKSLLVSTLKELFSANKELFKNTWIYTSDYKWVEYPVIKLDFSELTFETPVEFKNDLIWKLESIAENYSIDISQAPSLVTKFQNLIKQLSKKNKVVILIDEYDYPLLKNLDSKYRAKAIQKVMMSFFGIIKSLDADGFIHVLFITGVTKFSRASIFSGLNNIYDLSLLPKASNLLGYTEEEIKKYFMEHIEKFALKEKIDTKDIFTSLKYWYNGYRFSKKDLKVYNPYSVLYALHSGHFSNYWLETGTPGFLIDLLKSQYNEIEDIENVEISAESLGSFDIDYLPLVAILFQAGYITIADFDEKENKYRLDYPNYEVKNAFKKYIMASFTNLGSTNNANDLT